MRNIRGIDMPNFTMLSQYKDPTAEAGKFALEYAARKQQEDENTWKRVLYMKKEEYEKEQREREYKYREEQDKIRQQNWIDNFGLLRDRNKEAIRQFNLNHGLQEEQLKAMKDQFNLNYDLAQRKFDLERKVKDTEIAQINNELVQKERDNTSIRDLMTIPTNVPSKKVYGNVYEKIFKNYAVNSPEADTYVAAYRKANEEAREALENFDNSSKYMAKVVRDTYVNFDKAKKDAMARSDNNELNKIIKAERLYTTETVPALAKKFWAPRAKEIFVRNVQNLKDKKLKSALEKFRNFYQPEIEYARKLDNDSVPNAYYQDDIYKLIKSDKPSAGALNNIMLPYLQNIAKINKERSRGKTVTQSTLNQLIGLGKTPLEFGNDINEINAFLAEQNNKKIEADIQNPSFLAEVEKGAVRGGNAKVWYIDQLPRIREIAKKVDTSNSSEAVKVQNFINKYIAPRVSTQLGQWRDNWDLNLAYDPIEDAVVQTAEDLGINLDEIDALVKNK